MSIFAQTRTSKVLGVVVIAALAILTIPGITNAVAQPAQVGGTKNPPAQVGGTKTAPAQVGVAARSSAPTFSQASSGVVTSQASPSGVVYYGSYPFEFITENGQQKVKVTIGENTGTFSLGVYKMFDTVLAHQEYFSGVDNATWTTGQERVIKANLPPCMAQIDLYYTATAPRELTAPADSYPLLGWTYYLNEGGQFDTAKGKFCDKNLGQLTVEKTGPATVDRGGELTYGLKVTNTGSKRINSFLLMDNLADNLTFVRTNSASCSHVASGFARGTVRCQNTTGLNPGESISYQLTFKVDQAVACGAVIPNKADITSPDAPETWSNMTSTTVNCPVPQLVCTPTNQTVSINQNANFSAAGGNGTYNWAAPSAEPNAGSGATFATQYNTAGSKSVTVTSAGKTATCNVNVSIPTPQLVCTPANQTVSIGQNANFSATGGNGTYNWTAANGDPNAGFGANFATKYNSAGSKSVSVTSAGQTATCNVNVSTPTPQLVCTPASQNANLNQAVTVSVTGGNGSYSWSAPGASTATLNGSNAIVAYNSVGTKIVTVTSANLSASCQVVVTQQNAALAITKLVRNVTQNGQFSENISNVKPSDVLEYQIRIRNTGSVDAANVTLRDFVNQSGILNDFRNLNVSRSFSGQLYNADLALGALAPNAEVTVGYLYTVASTVATNATVCNTATTTASNANGMSDTACVTSSTGSPNLVLSKKAWNDTKNVDATTTPASREDYITYTLSVRNTGNADAVNFVVTDDLSRVLPLADMIDIGGGTLSGQTINYPALTIPANGTISKTFRVRIKYFLSPSISYQMINTYGNTITIVINPPTPYVPPRTGGMTDVLGGIGFAGLLTSAVVLHRKKNIFRLIFS